MGSPAIPPPPGAELAPLDVQQGAQAATKPPSIKRQMLGLIPFAGPMLLGHMHAQYLQDFATNAQLIRDKNQQRSFLNSVAMSGLSPEIRANAKQLQMDLTDFDTDNKGALTKPYSPELTKRLQALYGQAGAGFALQSSQANAPNNVPPALQWPIANQPTMPAPQVTRTGLTPPTAGGPEVPATDQSPTAAAPQIYMSAMQNAPPDIQDVLGHPAIQGSLAKLASQNLEIRSQGLSEIRAFKDQLQQQQQYLSMLKQYGIDVTDPRMPIQYRSDIQLHQPIRFPPVVNPGQEIPGFAGQAPIASSQPRLEKVEPGTSLLSIPPTGTPQPGIPPVPGSPTAAAAAPGGVTTLFEGGAKLTPEQQTANAAWEDKHKEKITPAKYPEALSEYTSAKMSPEQRAQYNISLALKNQQDENAKLRAIEIQQKEREWNSTHSPEAIAHMGQMVLADPDTFHEMQGTDIKSLVSQWLQANGAPGPPRKLGQTELDAEGNAQNALYAIAQARQSLQDPVIARNVGVILGNLGNLEQRFGTQIRGLTPQDEEKIQGFRTAMNYLYFQEGKSIFGNRMPQNLMKEFEKTTARTNMDLPMLRGALNGAEQFANQRINVTNSRRWGGQVPAAARGARGAPMAPPPPGGGVPANVKAVLSPSNVKPGIHKLSDGTSWRKAEDGTITQEQ